MSADRLTQAFEAQARACDRLGAPFTAALLRAAGVAIDDGTITGQRLLAWEGDLTATGDAAALRLAGALHARVRAGGAPTLAPLYPPAPMPEAGALADAIAETLRTEDAEIRPWLDRPPQTNEVGRSAAVYPGLMAIAAAFDRPMALFELGASGGLNLVPDRLAYVLGGAEFGDPSAPVTLAPDWTGPPPAGPPPRIALRRGCDLTPLDLRSAEMRARLAAYIWPDQPARLARLEAVAKIAGAEGISVESEAAASWIDARLAEAHPGLTRVVMHTIAFQYFDPVDRARITERIEAEGAAATEESPLAWLALELTSTEPTPALTLRLWPGDGQPRHLATAHAHGTWIQWLDHEETA